MGDKFYWFYNANYAVMLASFLSWAQISLRSIIFSIIIRLYLLGPFIHQSKFLTSEKEEILWSSTMIKGLVPIEDLL